MHPLELHSYVARSYRDPESMENVWIEVPVRSCRRAKALGRQYTKRLLPDFLIPFARMRLDKVIEAGKEKEQGSTVEKCCRIIGCNDLRTARMHLKRLEEAAKTVALVMAESQAAAVHLHGTDSPLRPLALFERLEKLLERQEEGQLRAGDGRSRSPALRSLLQAELWKKKQRPPTSYVSRPPP
ncbi:MAG: hypothetical protein SVR04_16390 [Spirochaetota bacterium]|nr:hypothetical protein [Spirochaetota bacterium]